MASAEGNFEPYGRIFNKPKPGRFPLRSMNRSFWARFDYFEVNGALVVDRCKPLLMNVTRLLCTETQIYEAQKAGG